MPEATFRPAPATDSTRRTASVTGSRAGSRSAGRTRSDAPAFARGFAPDPVERAAVLRFAPAVAAVFLVPAAPLFFAPAAPLFYARDAPPPSARFSLRRPGRDRGRFPITPESSLTVSPRFSWLCPGP
jgi:hypothetical protein